MTAVKEMPLVRVTNPYGSHVGVLVSGPPIGKYGIVTIRIGTELLRTEGRWAHWSVY